MIPNRDKTIIDLLHSEWALLESAIETLDRDKTTSK